MTSQVIDSISDVTVNGQFRVLKVSIDINSRLLYWQQGIKVKTYHFVLQHCEIVNTYSQFIFSWCLYLVWLTVCDAYMINFWRILLSIRGNRMGPICLCVSVWLGESYIVHHFNSTELCTLFTKRNTGLIFKNLYHTWSIGIQSSPNELPKTYNSFREEYNNPESVMVLWSDYFDVISTNP